MNLMKLEENRTLLAPRLPSAPATDASSDLSAWVVRNLPGADDRFLATAPGRLDVLGGLADYSGGLVLGFPLSRSACAGVQRRLDGMIRVVRRSADSSAAATIEIPLADLLGAEGKFLEPSAVRTKLSTRDLLFCCCIGTIVESMRAGLASEVPAGISIAVATDLEEIRGGGMMAAVSGALLTALVAMVGGREHGNGVAASVVQSVENQWLDSPSGPADALCSLQAEPDSLAQLRCDNKTMIGALRIPPGVRLVAIDTGISQSDHSEKYAQVRTATFMGRTLIDRIVRHDGLLADQWDGHLSRISVNDFVERIRDRLPTRLSGRVYLDNFGEFNDPLAPIDPDRVYKVRSRTEHHIYEHSRSRQFVEALSRGMRRADRTIFEEAGEVMNASHWSYGQRCGLGSVAANALVTSLRKAPAASGVFGARIAGRGCGGMVAVLTDDSCAATRTLEDSIESYQRDYNVPVRILQGSLPGALVSGAVRV